MRVKTYVIWKKITERNYTFQTYSEFFGERLKAQWDESGTWILAGDNTCCCRSGSSVMQFRYQLYTYTYTFDHMNNQLRLAQNSTCAGPSGAHLMPKSVNFCVLSPGVTIKDGFGVHIVAGGEGGSGLISVFGGRNLFWKVLRPHWVTVEDFSFLRYDDM